MANEFPSERLAELESAIFAGRKIEAIKLYRVATGLGLKESKDAVEKLEAELRAAAPEKFTTPAKQGCARSAACLALLFVGGVAAATWWIARTV